MDIEQRNVILDFAIIERLVGDIGLQTIKRYFMSRIFEHKYVKTD